MTDEEKERLRQENRERDPLMANLVDTVREVFPGAVLVEVRGKRDRAMTPFERRQLRR